MRRVPLGLVLVAAVLTRRSEDEATELFRAALAAEEPSPRAAPQRRGEHAARERRAIPRRR